MLETWQRKDRIEYLYIVGGRNIGIVARHGRRYLSLPSKLPPFLFLGHMFDSLHIDGLNLSVCLSVLS